MRILHIDTGREMRGGQWQVLRLMEGLRAAGVESSLMCRRSSPLFGLVGQAFSPAQTLRAGTFDLIHAHDAHAHTWAVALARTPLVVARRVAFPIGGGMLSRWKYRQAAHFIAVSQFVKGLMVKQGVPSEKVSVVYDGVPLLPLVAGGTRVLAPPPTRDKPAASYRNAGVEICFADNLAEDLKTAAIFVYLSMSEGLGSGVLLAMSAGVPVIASNTGGIPEIVRHEENGLLVDDRPESLRAAIERLRDDPALARRLADAGRRTVIEKFSLDAMVRDTLAVYRRLLSC